MDKKPSIAILSFSNIPTDGRVLRQIKRLSSLYLVDVIGYGHLPAHLASKASMHTIQPPTSMDRRARKMFALPAARIFSDRIYENWYWKEGEFKAALDILKQLSPDSIHANDWEALPVAAQAAWGNKAKIVLDLHEYAPLLRENRWYWRNFYKPMIEYFLHKYIPEISASITVNQTIANRYHDVYGISPIVVMNAPELKAAPDFNPTAPDEIHLIHHGNADPDRKIELMIETLSLTQPYFTLHLMLVERDKKYLAKLKALAQRIAPGRIVFHKPVLPYEIVQAIAQYDIGFYLLPALNFNQKAASPNKFFEFIMAGLAVCIGPSPEMSHLCRQYGFGIVAPSTQPAQVASILNELTPAFVDQLKQKAIAARSLINADVEMEKLGKLYRDLFESHE